MRDDLKNADRWRWFEHPLAATIDKAGNAEEYQTGGWRTLRPVVDKAKCNNCLICWIYCPDSAVNVKDEKLEAFDLDHCKGCGICAENCAIKAIQMVEETGIGEGA